MLRWYPQRQNRISGTESPEPSLKSAPNYPRAFLGRDPRTFLRWLMIGNLHFARLLIGKRVNGCTLLVCSFPKTSQKMEGVTSSFAQRGFSHKRGLGPNSKGTQPRFLGAFPAPTDS